MMLKGSHKHDKRDLNSAVFIKFGRREPIESTLRISDKTGELLKMSGEFTLNYPGRQIVINESLDQPEPNKYVSTFNGQLQKGQKTSVVTSFTGTSPEAGRLVTDIHFNKQTPYHIDTEWSLEPEEFFTRASYQKSTTRYAGSITSVTIPNLSRLVTDIEIPGRHVKLALEGRPKPDLWSGIAELHWNADRDQSERVTVSGWLEPVSDKRLNGSLSLYYPTRTLTLNAHHIIGAKYNTHADFAWEQNKKIGVDFIFGSVDRKGRKKIVSQAKIATPFDPVKAATFDVTYADVADEYKTDIDVTWDSDTISTTTIIRKPLSFRTVVGSFEARTPFKMVKKMKLDINHKLSDSLASAAKLSWNKKFVWAEVVLVNQTKGHKIAFKGDIDMKTSFSVMKKGTISLSHKNDGITFTTDGNFQRNRKKYGFTSRITHQPQDTGIANSGSVSLYCPYGNSETRWNHRNTWSNIATFVSTSWGNKLSKEIQLRINGKEDISKDQGTVEASIDLQTPFKVVRDIQVKFNHEHKSNFLDSNFKILKDKRSIAFIEAIYKPDSRNIDSHFIVTVPDLDVDSSIKIAARDRGRNEGAYISLDVVITPSISMGIILKAMFDDSFHSGIEFKSSFPGYRQISYTYDISIDKYLSEEQLTVVRQLHYGDGKVIEVTSKVVLDDKLQRGYILVTTPYDSLQKFEGNIHCEFGGMGRPFALSCDGYMEVLPHFEKISASAMWNTTEGLSSRLHVETPFQELSNLETSVIYKDTNRMMQAEVGLNYNSEHVFHADMTNDMSDETTYDISVKVSKPVSVILTHRGNLEKFKSKAELDLQSGRKMYGLDVGFSNQDKIEGSLTLAIPSRRDISAFFSHSGTTNSFATHAEILHNRKNQFLSDFSFSSVADRPLSVSGSASLKTELLQTEELEMEFHHEGWPQNFKSHAEFTTTSLGKSEADLSFSMRNDIDGSLSVSSPLMKNIVSSFNLHNSADYLQARADYIYGNNKLVNFLGTLNTRESFIGEVSLSNPLTKDITAMVRANGDVEDFVMHAKGSYGINKSDLELTSKFRTGYIEETLTIRTTGMPDITAEVSHTGGFESFKSVALINIGNYQHRMDASFNSLFDTEGTFSLTSPYVRPVSSRFSFKGMKTNFRSHIELVVGSDRSEMDTSFTMSPKIQGSFSLKTPYWMDISSEFDHTGAFPNVLSQAKLGYNGKQQFSAKMSLSTADRLGVSISVNTPFKDFENLHLAVSHEGQLKTFKCHGEAVINGDKTEGDIFYSSVGRYEGLMTLKSYLFEDLSVGFEHSGTYNSFKSHIEYRIGLTKTEGDVSVEIGNEVDISLRLRSPDMDEVQMTYIHKGTMEDFSCKAEYTHGILKQEAKLNFRNKETTSDGPVLNIAILSSDISFNLQHEGPINNFKTHSDLTYNGEKRVADVFFIMKENINGSVTVTAPMFSLKVNQNGDLRNFTSNIEIVNDYDRYASEAHLRTKNGVEAQIMFTSPIEGYENFKALYTHEGKANNFKCHGEISMPESLSICNLKLNVDTAFEGSLSLSSPVIPDISAEFDHSRTKSFYKSRAELSIDHEVMAGLSLSLDHSSGLDGDLHVMTPFDGYRNIRSSGRYIGHMRSFSWHQEVLFGLDRHEIDISYDSKPKHAGSVSIRSPLLPELDADFNYLGKMAKFDADTKLLVDGIKKFGVKGSFNIEDGVSVDFDIITPLENFTRIAAQLVQVGDRNNLRNDVKLIVEGKTVIKSNGQFLNDDKVSASASVESIFFDPVKASMEYQGSIKDFSSRGELFINDKKTFETAVKSTITPTTLRTTASLNENSATLNLDGTPENFKSHAELNLDRDIWATDFAFSIDKNLDASFSLRSPDHDTISGLLTHEKKYKKYKTHAELQLDADSKYEFDSTLNWRRSVDGTFSLKTPIEGYEDNSLVLSHEGEFPNIRSSARLSYPNNEISVSSDLNHAESTTGKLTLILPIEGFENIDLSFFREGSFPNFKVGGNIGYTTGKEIEMSVERRQFGTMEFLKLHLMSPFTNEMDFSLNHTGVPSNFVNSFGLSMGQDYRIDVENALRIGPEYFSYVATSTALLAGERLTEKISLNHQGNLQKFKTDASFSLMDKFVQMETLFQLEPVTECTVLLQSSFEGLKNIKAGFSHSGNQNGFLSTGELQLSPTERIEGKVDYTNHGWRRMVTNVELRTPFKGYTVNKLSYQHTGDLDSLQCDGEMVIGDKTMTGTISASKSPMNIAINIHTPFEDYERLIFSGSVDSDRRRGRYSSRMEASWNPSKVIVFDGSFTAPEENHLIEGSMSLSSPFQKLQRVSLDLAHRALSDKYMESLKASYNGKSLVDVELDHSLLGTRKRASMVVHAPKAMKFEAGGEFSIESVDVDLYANWDVDNSSNNLRAVAKYDFRPTEKTVSFQLTGVGQVITYSGSLDSSHSKSDFSWGTSSDQKIGYDITIDRSDARAKIILPSRSLEISGSKRGRITEGSFMWDADVDLTKKIAFRSFIAPSADSVKADLTLMLPSLGKVMIIRFFIAL